MPVTKLSRREFVSVAAAAAGFARLSAQTTILTGPYGNGTIPPGIRTRAIANVNGLTVNILEAGFERPGRPAVLLLHGFPELAYSWRKVMLPLAAAGYHVIAPDQRGYGRTTGWDGSYDADPDPFRILNMVRDAIALVYALGHRTVAMIAGHDAGAPVASWAALIRPDIFRSITILSSPFEGPPAAPGDDQLDAELATLNPPRKYYQNYQRTRGANDNMLHPPQGCTRSSAPTTTTRAPTGKATRRIHRRRASPRRWRRSRPTTSWRKTRAWRKPSRRSCRRPPRLPRARG